MPIPTELVGSLPRPMKLQEAYADYDEGKIGFERPAGRPGRGRRGLDQAPGGDRRADRHRRRAARVELRHLQPHRHAGRHRARRRAGRRRPVLRDLRRRPQPPAAADHQGPVPLQDLRLGVRDQEQGDRQPSGQAGGHLPLDDDAAVSARRARSTATRASSSSRTASTRPRRTSASASTPARCACRSTSPRAGWPTRTTPAIPWTGKNMLQEFIDLNNRLFARFSAEERKNIGIHTCPGGDCDSVHSKEVPYELLLEHMFDMNAGYFLIQCASEDDREKVYELCGKHSREDADGVAQVCFMGVINPLSPEVETPEHVRDELLLAAKHIPVERLGATDDCGFSPFSRDVKPKHGSPDFARDVAMQKISAGWRGSRWPPRSSGSESAARAGATATGTRRPVVALRFIPGMPLRAMPQVGGRVVVNFLGATVHGDRAQRVGGRAAAGGDDRGRRDAGVRAQPRDGHVHRRGPPDRSAADVRGLSAGSRRAAVQRSRCGRSRAGEAAAAGRPGRRCRTAGGRSSPARPGRRGRASRSGSPRRRRRWRRRAAPEPAGGSRSARRC